MSSKSPSYPENAGSNHPQKKAPQVPHGNPPRLSRDKVCLHGRHYRLAETWPLPATMEQSDFLDVSATVHPEKDSAKNQTFHGD
jgi:hypothetical protein